VRGYGLVDSPKMRASPGRALDLAAVPAPNESAAAHYYPAIHWYSMMKLPKPEDFGGKARIPENVTQREWMSSVKNIGCIGCHQLGQESTRTLPAAFSHIKSGEEAWMRRLMSGQSGQQMITQAGQRLGGAPFQYFADWTDRIAKGELPFAKPKRPEGPERNIVVTWWEWSQPEGISTTSSRRTAAIRPVNCYGPLYGSPEYSTDKMPILDPRTHKVDLLQAAGARCRYAGVARPGHAASRKPLQPSPYWGDTKTWDTKRTTTTRCSTAGARVARRDRARAEQSDFCKKGSDHPSAKVFPSSATTGRLAFLEPKTMKYTFVDTVLRHAPPAVRCAGSPLDQRRAGRGVDRHEGLPRNRGLGEGAALDAIHPGEWRAARRLRHLRRDAESRGRIGLVHGAHLRRRREPHPLRSAERHFRALQRARAGVCAARRGHRQARRGLGIDGERPSRQLRPSQVQDGVVPRRVVVPPISGARLPGHRRQQRRIELLHVGGPAQHARARRGRAGLDREPERRPHRVRGRQDDRAARALSDGLLRQGAGRRIDDPKAGWKGRGLWTTSGDRTPWLREGGKGSLPIAVQFQYRPDPLAR
jgi:hypothetical protein